MYQKEEILEKMQQQGKRITKQRSMMLDVILETNWESCKEIYYEAVKRDPSIGKATVYRMVRLLEDMGVIAHGYRYVPEQMG